MLEIFVCKFYIINYFENVTNSRTALEMILCRIFQMWHSIIDVA